MSAATSLVLPPPPAFPGFLSGPSGIYRDVPAATYHERILGVVSKGALDKVERSPAHYLAWANGAEDEETEALAIGRAAHCRILEPALFARTHVRAPDFGDLRFKENKAKRDEWRAENAGKAPIAPALWDALEGMSASVLAHPSARALLARGEAEVTARWEDVDTGLVCRARADWLDADLGTIVDLKTTEDARPDSFAKSVAKWRYHVQHAHYARGFALAGVEVDHFVFVAVEKKPPFAVAVYELDADAISRGEQDADRNMRTLAECLERDHWPAYAVGVESLSLPRWA